ncbi:MAG: hypothetical protein GXW89_09735 [Phycisphaerae bacterium]|nr:hypothetical protein [Phycisphaerae bacterium]
MELAAAKGLLSLPEAVLSLRRTDFRIAQDLLDAALARDAQRRKPPTQPDKRLPDERQAPGPNAGPPEKTRTPARPPPRKCRKCRSCSLTVKTRPRPSLAARRCPLIPLSSLCVSAVKNLLSSATPAVVAPGITLASRRCHTDTAATFAPVPH